MREKISKAFNITEGEGTDDIIPRLLPEFWLSATSCLFCAEQITSEELRRLE
jgi:hypothetical protein